MNENKNKIKNLPKIVSNQLRLSFTAFFLVSLVHSSQLFASDADGRLTQRLLDVEEGGGSTAGVISTLHSLNGDRRLSDEVSTDGFAFSPVPTPLELRGDAAAAEEDLYAAIDTAPAEDKMNKIIHYLAYLQGGELQAQVIAEYPSISTFALKDHLAAEAWSAATGGPLTEILQTQDDRIGKLIARCKQLKREKKALERDKDSFVKVSATALQKPAIKDVPALQYQIVEINGEVIKKRTTITYLKVALGSVITVAAVGYVTILTWMFKK